MSRTFELVDKTTGEVTFAGTEATMRNRCPVCQHIKGGWCLVDAVRGLTICPRTPSPRQVGEAGWMHGKDEKRVERAARCQPKQRPPFNTKLMEPMRCRMSFAMLDEIAHELGVTMDSLKALGVGWDSEHFSCAFPMRDSARDIVGIRLRRRDGFKFAVESSRNGLFYPELCHDGPVLLPEGPTDTAAMLSLGFDAIGRPFCRGGIEMLCDVFSGLNRPAVVIQDLDAVLNDDGLCEHCGDRQWCQRCRPGQFGAAATADALFGIASWVKVIAPPPGVKDARQWLHEGASHDSVMYRIEQEDFWVGQRVAT